MGSRHPLKTTSEFFYKEKNYWTRHPWKKYDGSDLDLSVDERVRSDVLSLVRPTLVLLFDLLSPYFFIF